ncbi:phosphocarrier protein [Thermotomaculum hydrothermale]|uniref:Phosphocarrier protein n=1 Tax=Thermotomaculum hydrothermale TaxID=981385 RepID=A0A7R6SY21_9BACT|nr:HPr family phosphocarrier protein [Thermotomaculum hydrothermale]BBB32309.1 phosphocarrier protein [Thermotomaculum hydrothermale]
MIEKKLVLKNKLGLHARAAAKLVQVAEQFKSDVKIVKDNVEADGKSILGVLLLAAPIGTELIFQVSGEDEEDAIKAIENLIEDKFGEEE